MKKSPTYLVWKESFAQLYTKPYLDADFYFYYLHFLFSAATFLRTYKIFCWFFFATDFMMKLKKKSFKGRTKNLD